MLETRKANPVAASEEHDLAAGEFATAAQNSSDHEVSFDSVEDLPPLGSELTRHRRYGLYVYSKLTTRNSPRSSDSSMNIQPPSLPKQYPLLLPHPR